MADIPLAICVLVATFASSVFVNIISCRIKRLIFYPALNCYWDPKKDLQKMPNSYAD
jgi:hypothetical protein